jgi:gliding motility-associated-like protein
MKSITYIFLSICFCLTASAQTHFVERTVISSGGDNIITPSNYAITTNIGEAVIDYGSNANLTATQGFEQANDAELQKTYAITFDVYGVETTCNLAHDGIAYAVISNLYGRDTNAYSLKWNNATASTNDTIYNLQPETYTATLITNGNVSVSKSITIKANNQDCVFEIKNGMTPNNDGVNDVFYIKGIELFPTNSVSIYNRWGGLIWKGNNYNNTSQAFEGKNLQGEIVPSGTYFYHLEYLDKTITRKKNDWIELTR